MRGQAHPLTDALQIDPEDVTRRLAESIRLQVRKTLRRRGVVVGLSGGIDSSVAVALAVRALGPNRVLALLMPEADSEDESMRLGRLVASALGVDAACEDITPTLRAAGCYRRRDEAIRCVIPEYGQEWRSKVVLPSVTESDAYRLSSVVARSPDGREVKARLTPNAYRQLVAATNFKQRTRKMFEYYHADRLGYAVVGTPNRLEYDQGFFVKGGDGAADLKPIAHLYKTQVYALGEHLGLPREVLERPPTTDTYSLPQTQEEFYFSLPYREMDVCLYAYNEGRSAEEVASVLGLRPVQVERVYRDIEAKRRATRYLHMPPLLAEGVPEVEPAAKPEMT